MKNRIIFGVRKGRRCHSVSMLSFVGTRMASGAHSLPDLAAVETKPAKKQERGPAGWIICRNCKGGIFNTDQGWKIDYRASWEPFQVEYAGPAILPGPDYQPAPADLMAVAIARSLGGRAGEIGTNDEYVLDRIEKRFGSYLAISPLRVYACIFGRPFIFFF